VPPPSVVVTPVSSPMGSAPSCGPPAWLLVAWFSVWLGPLVVVPLVVPSLCLALLVVGMRA